MSVREGSVWPKLLASFAGGIVCMSLLPEIGGTAPSKAPDARASLARESAPAAIEPEKPVVAEASPTIPEKPDAKPIRVITTDRVAPSPATAAAPEKPRSAAGRPAARKPAGDAASLPQETVEDAGPLPAATPLAPIVASNVPPATQQAASPAAPPVAPPVATAPVQPGATEPSSGTSSIKTVPSIDPAAAAKGAMPNPGGEPVSADSASTTPAQPADDASSTASPPAPVAASPAPKAKPRARVRTADAERRARAQRRLAEQEEFVDNNGTRLRTLRLLDGRMVTVRVPPPETRGRRYYDEADLPPPPPYARYRRDRSDSTMSWLDPPGY